MFRPNILTDGHADFFATQIKCFDPTGRLEVAIFIENVVGRQERLMCFTNGFATLEEGRGIMKRLAAPVVAIDEADE